jgi:RimJ/RimL family protein N-acetyltransferase
VDGAARGVARLDVTGGDAEVSIHLDPEWRGRGLGPAALERLAATAFADGALTRLVARIKSGNVSSLAAFRKADFVDGDVERGDGAVAPDPGLVTLVRTCRGG